jgi:hypothetical protein
MRIRLRPVDEQVVVLMGASSDTVEGTIDR